MSENCTETEKTVSSLDSTQFVRSNVNILETELEKSSPFQRRNLVTLFMFFAYLVAIILRSNVSIAIVDMTTARKVNLENGTQILKSPDYNWTSEECGVIISIFSVGQMFFSVPAGWMASKFGAVKVTGISTAIASLLTIFTPIILYYGVYAMILSRLLIGILQVMILVNMTAVTARWIPPRERSRVVGFSIAGANCGSAVCYLVSGYLAQFWRWPLIFYVTGSIGLLWATLWLGFVRESPAEDPWISAKELEYLSKNIELRENDKKHPWCNILTSYPVLALCVYRCVNGLDALFLRILIPLYVSDVLKLDVGVTGLITCVVLIPSVISMYLTGFIKDYLQNKEIMSRKQATFCLMSIGTVASTVMLFIISFITNHVAITVILMFIPFFSGTVNIIANVNSLELSSEYASTIHGLTSVFYTISQLVGPLYVGEVVTHHETSQWSVVLCTFATLELLGLVIFLMFGSTETQNFHKSNDKEDKLQFDNKLAENIPHCK